MISYSKVPDMSVGTRIVYQVSQNGKPIGYTRRSMNGPGWAYTLDPATGWTWLPHSTRHTAVDHLLSAYRPMAAWLS